MNTNTLPVGFELFWYEIQLILGQGGFGTTYLAHDKNLKKDVAIKEYLPREVAMRNQEDMTVGAVNEDTQDVYLWGLERFRAEAQILAQFQHRNIVRVMSVFDHNNTAYMIMEFEQGQDLSKMLKSGCRFNEQELMDMTMPILDGLEFLHQRGFVHRDIKPGNILLREDGSPVLIDFGSARQFVNEETRTLTSLLSNGYAPIEQYNVDTNKQGPWTDIYGLGATLYRLVSAKKPADAITRGLACSHGDADPLIPLRNISQGFSDTFLKAIEAALRVRPEDRPQSVAEWRCMLEGKPWVSEKESEEDLDGDLTLVSHQSEATKKSLESMNKETVPRQQVDIDTPEPLHEEVFDESLMVDITDRLGHRAGSIGHRDVRPEKDQENSGSGAGRVLSAGLLMAVLGGGSFYLYQNNLLPPAITEAITGITSTQSPVTQSSTDEPSASQSSASQSSTPGSESAQQQPLLSTQNPTQPVVSTLDKAEAELGVVSIPTPTEVALSSTEEGSLIVDDSVPVEVDQAQATSQASVSSKAQDQTSPQKDGVMSAVGSEESSQAEMVLEASDKPAAETVVIDELTIAEAEVAEEQLSANEALSIAVAEVSPPVSGLASETNLAPETDLADSLVSEPIMVEETVVETPPSEEEIQAAKVAELLSSGRQYLAEDSLTVPAGANALDTFREVISIDPDNAAAITGLAAIASRYSSLAAKPIVEGDWSKAIGLLERGQKAKPDHSEIKQQLLQIQSHKKTYAQLEQLVKEGQQRQANGYLIEPPGKSAWDSYRSALQVKRDHPIQEPLQEQAHIGLARIEQDIAEKAAQLIVVEDLAMAKLVLEGAKEKFPESAIIVAQEQALQAAIEAQLPRVATLIISHQELTEIDSPQISPLPVDRTIHIGFNYQNFQQQTSVIKAILYDGARSLELAQVPVVVTGKEGVKFIRMDRPVEGFAEGGYNVDLLLGEDRLKSVSFYVKRSNTP